ncbi:MAG: glycosyltransferase family 4 protein [Alicyclobacillaceae bacterium]|nr:glycosyltransferase family 4 protein [Alicyclobacillaceae bacterium]
MNILIVLPAQSPPAGGNWVFSNRLKRYLAPLGFRVHVTTLSAVSSGDIAESDIVHAFNASRTAVPFIERFGDLDRPFVITFTGTDVNEEMNRPGERERILQVARRAERLIFLTADAMEGLCQQYPEFKNRSVHIPLGIDVPGSIGVDRAHWGWRNDEIVFLLPAGLRPVKRPLDALSPLERLREERADIRFSIAGAVFDQDLLAQVQDAAASKPWFQWLGAVPHEKMGDLYRAADVVLNTSASEGLSHALLEAMAAGKAVLASRVPGNRDLIRHGEDGFLYRDANEFLELARRLAADPQLRAQLGRRAAARIAREFSPLEERDRYAALYRRLMAAFPCPPCHTGR